MSYAKKLDKAVLDILAISDEEVLSRLLADTLKKKVIADHFLATVASQPLMAERSDPTEPDWKIAYEELCGLARHAAALIKAIDGKA